MPIEVGCGAEIASISPDQASTIVSASGTAY
jgi:hypothetical protein